MLSCTNPHNDQSRQAAQVRWPDLMTEKFRNGKALNSSGTGSDCGNSVLHALRAEIVYPCDFIATERRAASVPITFGKHFASRSSKFRDQPPLRLGFAQHRHMRMPVCKLRALPHFWWSSKPPG